MKRIFFCLSVLLALLGGVAEGETATGFVFEDQNGNGVRDAGEPGLAGIPVSNSREVVLTDAEGRYTLPAEGDTILFVVNPSQWRTPVDPVTQLPRCYYVHRPEGSPKSRFGGVEATGLLPASVDFPLLRQEEPGTFQVLMFGDTQPRNEQEVDYLVQDIVTETSGMEVAFGATLGDLVFDNLSVFPAVIHGIGLIGAPWYHVIGNHDMNYDAPASHQAYETYARYFGPSWYAFNYGPVHFIVLNNIHWDVEKREYHSALGEAQLDFIANNLAHVSTDRLVVLMMHIPLQDIRDRDRLFLLLQKYPHTFSLSAHWHRQMHFFLGNETGWLQEEAHHHMVHGTACGAWWTGPYGMLGIPEPTMTDGTPHGYSIVTFSNTDYKVTYKAARRPSDYQMDIHAPASIASADAASTVVVANIFNGSLRSSAKMRLGGGAWIPMENYTGEAPFYVETKAREEALFQKLYELRGIDLENDRAKQMVHNEFQPLLGRRRSGTNETNHLWRANLPANPTPGYHFIEVYTTDMFGQEYTVRRGIRIE
jgi:hypothetical protein